jgi:YaiO family outer membrane protein
MKLKITLLILLFTVLNSVLIAQINSDSIFQVAINQVKNNQFHPAIYNAKKALEVNPNRGDILIFIGNIYSWENQNDTAMIYINQARNLNYKHDDFYEAWLNVLLRKHEFNTLLNACAEAEQNNYTNTEDLIRKRMMAYYELKMYDKGIGLIENPENKKYLDSKLINNLYSELLIKRNTKLISAYYVLDMFSGGPATASQHLASLGYSFPVGANNLGFRANYANRFGMSGVQLESDFYLKLQNKQYIYFNYGYAFNSVLFPTHRAGLEYYFALPAKMEASIGGRFMNYPTSNVLIATGHIEKYVDNSWFSLRPFYVYAFKTPNNTESFSLLADYRLFGKTALDYWGLEIGVGNSPDQFYSNAVTNSAEFNQLSAYKIKLEKNFMLNRISDFHLGLGYSDEEYRLNNYRNRFTVELGYKIRIR